MRKLLIIFILILFILALGLFVSRGFIFDKVKTFLIESIESRTNRGIAIENIGYFPVKGLRLAGVTVYKDTLRKDKLFQIASLDIKFSLVNLLMNKVLSPRINLHNFSFNDVYLNGVFGFRMDLAKNINTPVATLEALDNIWFKDFSVGYAFLKIEDMNGSIYLDSKSVKASDLKFIFNDEVCTLHFEIQEPLGETSSKLKLSSARFNINTHIKKENDIYKIPTIEGTCLNSSFELMGELGTLKSPVISLYGKIDIDTKDVLDFVSPEVAYQLERLNPEGIFNNSIYFRGDLKDIGNYELGLKTNADYVKIKDFKIDKFYMDARVKDGVLNIPIIKAYPYKGVLVSSITVDLTDDFVPYKLNCRLSNVDIASLLQTTALGDKNITGLLFSEVSIKGDAKDQASMEGAGRIIITEANLGPMPLLTPLLGNLYGYFQHTFTGLKKIEITKGSCDFYIANGKLTTDNLTLWGDLISIHAKGYIDFDKNLNFDVENQFAEPEDTEKDDWQTSLQEMIVRFGKLMSKARLTGTLDKPKWKFEYLGGVKEAFGGGLDKVLKGIFE